MKLIRTSNIPFLSAVPTYTSLGLLADFNPAIIITEDSTVTSWLDSVSGRSVLADTNKKPVFNAVDSAFKGKPSVSVSANNRFLDFELTTDAIPAMTVSVVTKRNAYTNGMIWALQDSAGSVSNVYDLWNNDNILGINNFNGNCYGPQLTTELDSVIIITIVFESSVANTAKYYVNGIDVTSSCFGFISARGISNHLWIGGCNQGYNWDGSIARMMVYNRMLEPSEVYDLNQYLLYQYV